MNILKISNSICSQCMYQPHGIVTGLLAGSLKPNLTSYEHNIDRSNSLIDIVCFNKFISLLMTISLDR